MKVADPYRQTHTLAAIALVAASMTVGAALIAIIHAAASAYVPDKAGSPEALARMAFSLTCGVLAAVAYGGWAQRTLLLKPLELIATMVVVASVGSTVAAHVHQRTVTAAVAALPDEVHAGASFALLSHLERHPDGNVSINRAMSLLALAPVEAAGNAVAGQKRVPPENAPIHRLIGTADLAYRRYQMGVNGQWHQGPDCWVGLGKLAASMREADRAADVAWRLYRMEVRKRPGAGLRAIIIRKLHGAGLKVPTDWDGWSPEPFKGAFVRQAYATALEAGGGEMAGLWCEGAATAPDHGRQLPGDVDMALHIASSADAFARDIYEPIAMIAADSYMTPARGSAAQASITRAVAMGPIAIAGLLACLWGLMGSLAVVLRRRYNAYVCL